MHRSAEHTEQIFICESKRQLLNLDNKIIYNFKIGFKFVNDFLIQTKILAEFNSERSKVISFSKINRFLRSTTQAQRFEKKI